MGRHPLPTNTHFLKYSVMAEVSKSDAILRLLAELDKFAWDDVVEIHNELFPFEPLSVDGEPKDVELVRKTVKDRITEGLESEEIIDLWNVVFPAARNVWYDDENECVRFNGEPQQVESSD
jgi:hypothetical protein